jgi:flagella basal body P-ring formation protein FlgA
MADINMASVAPRVPGTSSRTSGPVRTPKAEQRSTPGRTASLRAAPAPGKRPMRMPEVVLGVLLVAGCAFGAVAWQRSTNQTMTVVVASRPIARGSVIGIEDLRGAQIGGETGAMIAGTDARLLLGKVAVVDIDASVPLTATLLTDAAPLGSDEALSSVALEPGHLPPDLAAGDRVRIIVTSTTEVGGTATSTLIDQDAIVWAVDAAADGRTTVVTMRGSIEIGTAVAAAEQVHLVRVDGPA